MVDVSAIESAQVLRELTQADLAELATIAQEQEFAPRDCVFRRGEEAETFYIATSGRFALTVALRVFDDYTPMAVEEKHALDAFGWSSLVAPHTSIYTCYCIEAGAVVAFPREPLEALMATHSQLATTLLRNLNELIGTRVRVVQELWLDEVSQSIARVQHWTHTELTAQLTAVMTDERPAPWRRWFRRQSHVGPGEGV